MITASERSGNEARLSPSFSDFAKGSSHGSKKAVGPKSVMVSSDIGAASGRMPNSHHFDLVMLNSENDPIIPLDKFFNGLIFKFGNYSCGSFKFFDLFATINDALTSQNRRVRITSSNI